MTERTVLTWPHIEAAVERLAARIRAEDAPRVANTDCLAGDSVWGIPRGGVVPAVMLARTLGLPLVDRPGPDTIIVDDLIDSGATMRRALTDAPATASAVALFRKPAAPKLGRPSLDDWPQLVDGWVVFPWEADTDEATGPTDAVVRLLQHIGEDPTRAGLFDTPKRVVKALAEMTCGYAQDPATILERRFPDTCDEMVVVRGIEFTSMCEHHMLTFSGVASVAYIPNGEVVGLSKLARLVDALSRRLQVQERMTEQIADAMEQHLRPLGVAVVVRGKHSCMGCRGVRKPGAEMVTSSMRGYFRDRPESRAEFLALADA